MTIKFKKPETVLPEDYKVVIIRYRDKIAFKGSFPYEVGSAYRYNGQWWMTGHYDNDSFREHSEITGWAYYGYNFQKEQTNG